MRLRRLALARYGKFTDRTIDFGEAVEGEPDFHIVYGENEAGKSTAFAGFLDLLFGIEMQSRYNFLHPYEAMRVGGCLELSVGARELVRIKKPQPTLRDAGNQPVAEGLIRGDLGGLDRASYRTMFSLDDETLEAGGDSILASNGELGQLLFSASAGLSELSRTLLELRSRADGFTWPNARSGELQQLKAQLAILKQERDAVDTLASQYNRLTGERDEAASRYEAALAEQSGVQAGLTRIRRMLAALPHLAGLRRVEDRLERLGDLPVVPLGWLAELPGLEQAEGSHRSGTELADAEVKRLSRAIEALDVDAKALGLAGGLERLTTLNARSLTADLDLPLRRRELARVDGEVRSVLVQLGREDEVEPGRLLLTAAQTAPFDALVATRSGIEAQVASARDEQEQAALELAEARRTLQEYPTAPSSGSLGTITSALQVLRESDHLPRLRTAARTRDRYIAALVPCMAAVAPWTDDVEDLAALAPPDVGMIEVCEEEAKRDAALVVRRREEVDRLEAELAVRTAELDAVEKVGGLPGDREAADIRTAREAAWALHRHALDPATADAFEAAMRRDDLATGMRLGHERELARLGEARQGVLIKRAELERARALLAEATRIRQEHAAAFEGVAASFGPQLSGQSPERLLAWMRRREDALECRRQIRQAEEELREAEADAVAARRRLVEALAQAGVLFDRSATVDALAVVAQAMIDLDIRVQSVRRAVQDCERVVRRREVAARKASGADEAWLAAWRSACSGCWFGEATASLLPAAVKEMLAVVAELGSMLKERANLNHRIRAMEADQVAFGRELRRLATALDLDQEERFEPDLAGLVSDRIHAAQQADEARRRLRDELAAAEDHARKVGDAARAHARRVDEMMGALKVGSLIEVAGKLRDVQEKDDLRRQAGEAERQVLVALHVETLAEAVDLLGTREVTALEGEEAGLSTRLRDLEGRSRELFAANKEASDRIDRVGGDDAAARVEERRRTQLLEIEDKARHYLRLRLGIAAADCALRAYRDQHRSSMLTQASDAFSLISRGAYRGLGTQPGKDGDILVAPAADGGSKMATDLSKGTRFQLYLALRAAGYHEFARSRPPVPFIADDIMETFDDFRAEETLRMLGEMSRLGQVVYLTHHNHLRDIAERAVPGVRVHELAA